MKNIPTLLNFVAAICLLAVSGLAASPMSEAASEPVVVEPPPELPVAAALLLPGDPAVCAIAPAPALSEGCDPPPGCAFPEAYCSCIESGSYPEWVCRWYSCE